jgi:pyridoxine kinase
MQKHVLAIHDISCCGRCSITVALPILSAGGLCTTILPTAVLSTHTGGFTNFTVRDLTDDLLPIAKHWHSLDLHFDAIYTGYLANAAQVDIILQIIDLLADENTLICVDPVMADNGKLYGAFDEHYPSAMRKLACRADILMPNITEAALLTETEYKDGVHIPAYIDALIAALQNIGAKTIVLTGVLFDEQTLGAVAVDSTGQKCTAASTLIEGWFHGTGDVFSSALLAKILGGETLKSALSFAVAFTVGAIKRTKDSGADAKYGVEFEAGLRLKL